MGVSHSIAYVADNESKNEVKAYEEEEELIIVVEMEVSVTLSVVLTVAVVVLSSWAKASAALKTGRRCLRCIIVVSVSSSVADGSAH